MRPFSLVGLCYLLTLAAAVYFGAAPSLLLGSACLAVFCLLILWKRTERMRILQAAALTCALAFGAFSACARAQVLPSEKLDGRDAVMTGTVCELPARSYGKFYYVVRVESISLPGAPRVEKVRLSSQNALNADCYGTITGRVHFYTPSGEDGFSSRSYYASKGITLFAYLYEYENVRTSPAREKPPYYYALMLRRSMTDSLYRLLPPEQAGLAAGILLGDTGGISDEVKSDFKTVGISHILSVSGLHMAAMAQFFLLLFGLLRVPRRLSAGMTMAGVVSFMAVTGFAPSVLRSGIMCLIFLLGTVLDRQADSLNSLGIAALLIGVANPFAAADLGLLLSFSATLGMILCSGRLTAFLRARYEGIKRGRAVLDAANSAVSTTVSATAFTLPVVVLSFGTVSLISPAANLLEVFPSSLLMAFSAAAALCYLVGLRFLALPLALFSGLLANWMSACARMLARIPWASVSASYGFWLGDAFASGGSAGYDHKEMGITARGAWEAVKRHFREVGKDIQTEPFTVVGVGDMSGDVFGNGMLLSQATKVVAAFDHRDIFIDPNPDVAKSWAERKRLFETPRTSWQDYDKSLISEGGGVFSRSAKSIALTPQIKELLDIEADTVDPVTLMQAILKARAELLYFGGIGTYIKGAGETNAQAGDKANDAIRINGGEVRALVLGEGANLGATQLGRIEAARAGMRLNTDAIDNSAGVDSSDQEVNIKILLGGAIASGHLKAEDRNPLLKSMTDEVGLKVLAHNYDQTLALTLQQAEGPAALDAQQAFMQHLSSLGKLNRAVEYLPDDVRIAEMKLQGAALTRPELAVLTAYSKLELFDEIVGSSAPDDAFFERLLVHYFPAPLAKFEEDMKGHRLRRDIIATVLSNEIVNMAGPTFADRLRAAAECDTAAMVTAFETARHVFRLDEAWKAVSALDLKIPNKSRFI